METNSLRQPLLLAMAATVKTKTNSMIFISTSIVRLLKTMKKRSFENDYIDTNEENASSFASRKKMSPMQSYQELMEDMERDMINLGLNTTTMPKMNNSRKRRFDDTESDANGRLLSSSSSPSSSHKKTIKSPILSSPTPTTPREPGPQGWSPTTSCCRS